ncbi:Colicin V production protein [Sulfurimonas denitrificans DSM 1251]|jgi:membrane protein required for colicin V production|uniref:Colicin V production protein n=1 Tax=Sulfurimonas denitrificans (strain ATCC 33889 / DSM 1251) TaxID=326298 RepID=Q30R32_SULDN|nr:CvpA family protein [Sulfurimonas denitrificans]ABB44549.1 Colicin V production protein [Sulfurimonas denitrificans DSM 1251]MDD3441733.1 CvpA family protein [Sulfurimonas denitrificans]
MAFSYFDIIVSILVLFLGLKGILNGFFKEIFGLIGIIGGIFIASRVGDSVGKLINDSVLKFQNDAAVSFTGFLVTLALFWLFMIGIGVVFKKLSSLSGLGIFDKIFGFLISAGKFFLIASVILYSTYNIKAMRANLDSMMKNSILFPILVETGSFIMKLDPIEISDEINATIGKGAQIIEDEVGKKIEENSLKIVEDTKKKLDMSVEDNLSSKGDK